MKNSIVQLFTVIINKNTPEERTIKLSREEMETLEAIYHCCYSGLKMHLLGVLWQNDLLWSDCNQVGCKLNFDGVAFLDGVGI